MTNRILNFSLMPQKNTLKNKDEYKIILDRFIITKINQTGNV